MIHDDEYRAVQRVEEQKPGEVGGSTVCCEIWYAVAVEIGLLEVMVISGCGCKYK